MKTIQLHTVEGDTKRQLLLATLDEQGPGGAHHHYVISGYNPTDKARDIRYDGPHTLICFQDGPIADGEEPNGLTQEVLAAIIIDRLQDFQKGKFACQENEDALRHFESGLAILQERTKRRIAKGIEGTLEVDPEVEGLRQIEENEEEKDREPSEEALRAERESLGHDKPEIPASQAENPNTGDNQNNG